MTAAAHAEVTSDRIIPGPSSDRIAASLNQLFRRGQRMSTPLQQQSGKIDVKTIITVLGMCGATGAWVFNYVGGMRDSVRDTAMQVQFMKEDIKRLDISQTKVQQDVREDLRRIEDKLDRAINDRTTENSSVRKWAK